MLKTDLFRQIMKKHSIDMYIITTGDFHGSEYVGDYFKTREFVSGFTGSAGTLVVTHKECVLFTDGRYFLQAEIELSGSGISLMKMGEPGVPSIEDYIYDSISSKDVVGFDGRTVSCEFADRIMNKISSKGAVICPDMDLTDEMWEDRPPISKKPVWELEVKYTGPGREEKIQALRQKMDLYNADYILLTALDEIAWMLNLRGNDIKYTPVFLSFFLIGKEELRLYVYEEILNSGIKEKLRKSGISIFRYDDIYKDLGRIPDHKRLIIDDRTANYNIRRCINRNSAILTKQSPVVMMKSVKNPVETENIRKAHIKDGAALTKFIYWLYNNISNKRITEISAAEKLEEIRRTMEGYIGEAFAPIVAYGEHGAVVHYCADIKTSSVLKPKGLCLIDTGGHYLEGTTDVTRTVPLGSISAEEKKAYTLVMKGHLNLANSVFKYGTTGAGLDYAARSPLWEYGMDYNHGTGHGVGYVLSVHEGPQRISWNACRDNPVLEEGMVISDEPGYYEPGKFGIRHENLVIVRKGMSTEYGQFMYFENLTMVPFDSSCIDREYMTGKEIRLFNDYQQKVFQTISGFFEGDELKWLREYTTGI